jgi:hypothetical protein
MDFEQAEPLPPGNGYPSSSLKHWIRYLWRKALISLAIQLIVILYKLVRFLLRVCPTEECADSTAPQSR